VTLKSLEDFQNRRSCNTESK